MHLRACVKEKGGDGEGAGSYVSSDTLGYINLVVLEGLIDMMILLQLNKKKARARGKSVTLEL
jgi:hypothetical protein